MAAIIKIQIDAQASGNAAAQVARDLDQIDGSARKASGGLGFMGQTAAVALGGAVVGAATAAAGAVAGFVSGAVSQASTFESGLNEFAAAAGGALDEAGLSVQDFSNLFLKMGAELPVSTAEVQQAAIALVKGGLDPAVIAGGALESSLKFAAAAGMELDAAAELGVKMLGTFTSVTDDAATKTAFLGEAQNLLVKAANASTLNVDALGDAMLAAGGQARAAGLEYEDFVTTMGLISPAFGSAAEAGTSFKNLLTRLQPTTKEQIGLFHDLNLITEEGQNVFYDAQGGFLGMENAAEQLQVALGDLSEKERLKTMQVLFGNDAMGAAAALADGGAEAYQAFAAQMANANGVSEQAAATQQGLGFAMTNLSGTIEAVQIRLGTALLPILTEVVTWFNNLIAPMATNSALFDQIGAAAAQAGAFLQANWQPVLAAIAGVIGAVVVPALVSFVVAFGPIIAVVGAAIAVGMALYNAWTNNFMGIQGIVFAALTAIQAYIMAVMGVVLAFWQANGAQIMAFAQTAWTQISQIIGTVVAIIATVVQTVFGAIATFINTNSSTIQVILQTAWNSIKNIITLALNLIQGITTTVLGVLQGDWGKAADGIQQIVDGLKTFVVDQFNNLKNIISTLGPGFVSAALGVGRAIIDGIKDGVSSGIEALKDMVKRAAQSALDAAKRALGIKSPSSVFAMQVGLPAAQGIAMGLQSGIPMVAGAGAGAAGAALAGGRSVTNNATRNVTYNATFNGIGNAGVSDAIARSLAGV
jgi:TP901 family phage tail tape measure protein